jgi:hypothetical protein
LRVCTVERECAVELQPTRKARMQTAVQNISLLLKCVLRESLLRV